MNKQHYHTEAGEKVAMWIKNSGYTGDLSALAAGLHDLFDGLNSIYKEGVPSLLSLNEHDPGEFDKASEVLSQLAFELDHLGKHCEEAKNSLESIATYLDTFGEEFA